MGRLTDQQALGLAREQERRQRQHTGNAQRGDPIQHRHLQQLRGQQSDQGKAEAEQGGTVFQQHGEGGRILAATERLEVSQRALAAAELAQRNPP
ncbi:hypothetical protein D3C81_1874290 [compost metagenome]